ncbi:hypothetical protein ABH966_003865 [Lysinibacillus sp. RC46]|uniref:hypothetical protein n=1 Tax=unclassified Lysinibacillus TaxID=2636778 RepID=UPI003510DE5E
MSDSLNIKHITLIMYVDGKEVFAKMLLMQLIVLLTKEMSSGLLFHLLKRGKAGDNVKGLPITTISVSFLLQRYHENLPNRGTFYLLNKNIM